MAWDSFEKLLWGETRPQPLPMQTFYGRHDKKCKMPQINRKLLFKCFSLLSKQVEPVPLFNNLFCMTLNVVLVYFSFQVGQFSSRYCHSRGELCIARHYELCTHIWRSPTLRSCQQRPLESLVDPQTPLCCWCEGPHVQCTLYTVYYTAQVKVR